MPAHQCFTNYESCKAVSAKRKKEYKPERISAFFGISIVGPGLLLIRKDNKSTYSYQLQLTQLH